MNINDKLSFDERISLLEKDIETLRELKVVQSYFDKIKKYKNSYVVEMRRVVTMELFNKGINKSDIGRTLGRHHSSIIHSFKVESTPEVIEAVKDNYKDWIRDNKYPISVPIIVPSYVHPTGYKTTITYELRDLE